MAGVPLMGTPHSEAIMNLTKWDPFRELEDMSQRLNRVFGRSLISKDNDRESLRAIDWVPAVDVSETDRADQIHAELPDVNKEDVKVTVADGTLTLQGERRQEKEEKSKRFHRIERSYGSFLRSSDLPDNVDASAIKAEFKDGMLAFTMPKTAPTAATKAIEVKVS